MNTNRLLRETRVPFKGGYWSGYLLSAPGSGYIARTIVRWDSGSYYKTLDASCSDLHTAVRVLRHEAGHAGFFPGAGEPRTVYLRTARTVSLLNLATDVAINPSLGIDA